MTNLPPFHADRLRAFVAVAKEGGFTRAARSIGRSQSSVSEAVSLLESELSETLLVRDGRSVRLTDAGHTLLGHAERIFDELEQARANLAALRDLSTGRLVLGTTDTFALYLLPDVFAAFRSRYPGVEMRLINRPSPSLAEQVAERELDLAVASLPLPPGRRGGGARLADRVRITRLTRQRDVFICSPAHPLSGRRRIELGSLDDVPLVLLDRSTSTRALLDARFEELDAHPRVVMEMNSVEVLKRLVELDFGASIVPEMSARREVEAGTLEAIELRGLGRSREIGLLTPTAGPLSHAARAFIELANQRLRSA